MNTYTTNMAGWLKACGPSCSNEAFCIEQCILNVGERYGSYRANQDDGLIFLVHLEKQLPLCLSCADAVDNFLSLLRSPYSYDLNTQRELDAARLASGRATGLPIKSCKGSCRSLELDDAY